MHTVLIIGAGKIGTLIAGLLIDSGIYKVSMADHNFSGADFARLAAAVPQIKTYQIDVTDKESLLQLFRKHSFDAVISGLPYYLNLPIAEAVKPFKIHYFDLTEDVRTSAAIKELAGDAANAYVPQCGLAPGFIGIAANSLMQNFTELESAKLRVGALPQQSSHALQYSLTWSTDGLINEYGNSGVGISNKKFIATQALEGLEELQIDGQLYEAFNTSGGIGSLAELYIGKIDQLNYKTIRYPGHCQLMRFLMLDLKLNQDRDILKRILENALPKTYQDVVIIYVSVSGKQNAEYIEESYFKKIYPKTLFGLTWSAIQVSTASGLCAVLDLSMQQKNRIQGYILQEKFALKDVLANQFGKVFK